MDRPARARVGRRARHTGTTPTSTTITLTLPQRRIQYNNERANMHTEREQVKQRTRKRQRVKQRICHANITPASMTNTLTFPQRRIRYNDVWANTRTNVNKENDE